MLRALLDDAGPARFVGLGQVGLAVRAFELDRLDAGLLLALDVGRVRGRLEGSRIRLDQGRRIGDHLALRGVELAPGRLVDEEGNLGRVEAGVDAEFGLLVPAEIEDARGRPAIAVDDTALERGIDLAGRGLHDGGAERGEEVAVDRGYPDLEPGQIGLEYRLRQIDVERRVADLARKVDGVHLLVVELGHVVEAAVLAQLRHRPLGELPGIRLGEYVGVERARDVGYVDDAGLERIADLERRHGLGAADIIDADLTLALGVHDLDEALETA